jgi:hypothetical protein
MPARTKEDARADPISGNFQFAVDAFGKVHEVNGAAELVRGLTRE